MTFCDHFIPSDEIRCFVCDDVLTDWDGFDGPCVDLTFRQGIAIPELPDWKDIPTESGRPILDPNVVEERLPNEFVIYSHSCGCDFGNRARVFSENGVWVRCELITGSPEDRILLGSERKQDFRRRMKWLGKITP